MLVIFGFRTYVRSLAIITLVCGQCDHPAAHRVAERVRKFTLFFVPLFPVSKRRSVTCTFCGQRTPITSDQADQYLTSIQPVQAQAAPIESIPQPPPPQ